MYTRLPLADDIREARTDHGESASARLLLQRVTTTAEAVDTVERQHERAAGIEGHIPGDDLIVELSEGWSVLADLPSVGPRSSSTFTQQLQARRTQLALAEQVLRPIARELGDRLERLQALQLEQRARLDDPGFAQVLQQIQGLNTEREAVIAEFQPLQQRLGIVDPTLTLLDNFIGSLSADEVAGKAGPDPAGAVAWRTAYLAGSFLRSVEDVLSSVDFGIDTPEIPAIPAQPDPQTATERWAEVAVALDAMRTLRGAIDAHAAEMRARARVASHRFEEISAQILDLTG